MKRHPPITFVLYPTLVTGNRLSSLQLNSTRLLRAMRLAEQRLTQLQIDAAYQQIYCFCTGFDAQAHIFAAPGEDPQQLESYGCQLGIYYEVHISEKHKWEREQAIRDDWEGARLGVTISQNNGDLESSCDGNLGSSFLETYTQVTELSRECDSLNCQIEYLRNELAEAKREVVLVRRSIVEEK
ncbi:hypothetical protein H4582DRAFT_334953 [Lactarius indigo]|nr:hypothetical protein H4582DRAFT_334953 [Lactarius indigo]